MSRAAGRKNLPRQVKPNELIFSEPDPKADKGVAENIVSTGNYIGESPRQDPGDRPYESPIPGGSTGGKHLTNHPTQRQSVPVPAPKPEHRGIMAHGVPYDKHTVRERAQHLRGEDTENLGGVNAPPIIQPKYLEQQKKVSPVPVYVVDTPGQGNRPLHTLAGDKFTVPASTSDPIRVAGRDLDRTEILFLVETAAGAGGAAPTGVRLDHEVGNLTNGRGFLIPAGTTSYQRFRCNDEMFAVSNDASACTISVVYLYGVAGAG